MFDDLRQEAISAHEEEKKPKVEPEPPKAVVAAPRARKRSKVILGMTGPQRFAVSVMLLLMACVIGFMFLFVTNKIGF